MANEEPRAGDTWTYLGQSDDGGPFLFEGVDVWRQDWKAVGDTRVEVRDPLYGRLFQFRVYEVRVGDRTVTFAAGEFSPNVWGFFTPLSTLLSGSPS